MEGAQKSLKNHFLDITEKVWNSFQMFNIFNRPILFGSYFKQKPNLNPETEQDELNVKLKQLCNVALVLQRFFRDVLSLSWNFFSRVMNKIFRKLSNFKKHVNF